MGNDGISIQPNASNVSEPTSTGANGSAADYGGFIHEVGCGCPLCSLDDRSEDRNGPGTVNEFPSNNTQPESLQGLADYLRVGYWTDVDSIARKFNLGSTGPNPKFGVLEYNLSGFSNKLGISDSNGISEPRKELVRESFKLFEEVLGIDFVETSSASADIFFSDNRNGAFAASTGLGNGLEYSVVNVASSWSEGTSTYDDYTLQTILHEIGHALGLGHQGLYNGTGSYPGDAVFANDSWQASMMSYFSQTENTSINASFEFLQTPMAADWIALQDIYGDATYGTQNAFNGNTVYGFNTNITSQVSDIWAEFSNFGDRTASTIIDGGGVDTLDVSGYAANQLIDLSVTSADADAPTTMNIGGRVGNLTLAAGTVIENAIGGAGDDTFFGNAANNLFRGRNGNDTFNDSAGNDTYIGGLGTDEVNFFSNFVDYSFAIAGSFLQVIDDTVNAVTDFVDNSVEWLNFADVTLGFDDITIDDDDQPESNAALEFGKVTVSQSSPNKWTTVSFSEPIEDAVVTLGAVTFNGWNPVAPRIRNVTDEGFEVQLPEFSYHNSIHVSETVTWVAVSAGTHQFGGLTVEAGTTTSAPNEGWVTENFGGSFSDKPVVFAQIASTNEPDALVTRISDVEADQFRFQLQEEEQKNGVHLAETVHWIAFEQGDGTAFDAALTANAVTQNDFTVGFDPISAQNGIFLAGMQTRDGPDTASLRLRDYSGDEATFFVQEETSADDETNHTTEVVGFITAEDGFWFA